MKKPLFLTLPLLILFFFQTSSAFSQQDIDLDEMFSNYKITTINSNDIYQNITKNRSNRIHLEIDDKKFFNLELYESEIISKDYLLREILESGENRKTGTSAIPMQGFIENVPNSRASITFNDGFIYGYIQENNETWFIEPLKHFKLDANKDDFIVYNTTDIIPGEQKTCGFDAFKNELQSQRERRHDENQSSPRAGNCYIVNIAIASDYSMRSYYGSVNGVENHNIGVLNNVQTNYTDDFADEIQFEIVEQYISSCSSCDPWSSTTNPGNLLSSFRVWGNGSNSFTSNYNVASLWTRRDFQGSTIGIAYLDAVCTSYRYNCLQDFTSNAQLKRVLQAHELGHNFDADHDVSGTYIMSPSVANTNNWSTFSKNRINSNINYISSCLGSCVPTHPNPEASFSYNSFGGCFPVDVSFSNSSTNATSYSWSFQGGSPSSSTQTNPVITYSNPGTYGVTLTAYSGNNSDVYISTIQVQGEETPQADFYFNIYEEEVYFYYAGSEIGNGYITWDFGDGFSEYYDYNVFHTYENNGTYDVTLTLNNQCGTSSITYQVTIAAPPKADFEVITASSCTPFSVLFTNKSLNADSYFWEFPGGTPSYSYDEEPSITYNNVGSYDVFLTAYNSVGESQKIEYNFIVVSEQPIVDFIYDVDGFDVSFTNTSSSGDSFEWDFGDGNISYSENPIHSYEINGTYLVSLAVTTSCGTTNKVYEVVISNLPSVQFSVQETFGCTPFTVQFSNNSTNADSYQWTFPGGTPSSSTDFEPEVVYNSPGSYDVILEASNSEGTEQFVRNDYIVVNKKPAINFSQIGDELSVQFNSIISGGTNPHWDFGDGTSTTGINNPIHEYAEEGTYTVTLTDQNECGTTVFTKDILVQLAPQAGFTVGNTEVCPEALITFINQSSPSVISWNWVFEGGIPGTSTEQNPTVQYIFSGTYDVQLTVSDGETESTIVLQDYIVVKPRLIASFEAVVDGNLIHLENTTEGNQESEWYIVTDGYSTVLNGNSVDFVAPFNGEYIISLTTNDECSEVVSKKFISVDVYPTASFNVNAGLEICKNEEVVFSSLEEHDSYSWSFDEGSPSTSKVKDPVVIFENEGSFEVTLIVSNNYGSDTLTQSITVVDQPIAEFDYIVADEIVDFNYTGTFANNIIWDFGDGKSGEGQNIQHKYGTIGSYLVLMIASNECGIDTVSQTIEIQTTPVKDVIETLGIEIYPNPTSGVFYIKVNQEDNESLYLSTYTITSERAHDEIKLDGNSDTHRVDFSSLKNGAYIIYLRNDKIKVPYKLFILR